MKVFLSHSSADQDFVRSLAEDLVQLGHQPWLDEWEIRVGDCIVRKVEEGLADTDYVIVVLTPEAVASGWVDREWRTAYWEEIEQKRVVVLPVLLRLCDKPPLLRTKKHADFTKSYAVGFAHLAQALVPLSPEDRQKLERWTAPRDETLHRLLADVQGSSKPLAQCIALALPLAEVAGDAEFTRFCRNELGGWPGPAAPPHRRYEAFICKQGPPNPSYIGWGGNVARMWAEVRANRDLFLPAVFGMEEPIAALEAKYARPSEPNTWSQWDVPATEFIDSPTNPEARVTCIAASGAGHGVYLAVRGELTRYLLGLLPSKGTAGG